MSFLCIPHCLALLFCSSALQTQIRADDIRLLMCFTRYRVCSFAAEAEADDNSEQRPGDVDALDFPFVAWSDHSTLFSYILFGGMKYFGFGSGNHVPPASRVLGDRFSPHLCCFAR